MKITRLFGSVALIVCVAISSMLYVSGCKESTTEPEDTIKPITDDLYPLIVGRKLVFSGFLRDKTTDVNIDATGAHDGSSHERSDAIWHRSRAFRFTTGSCRHYAGLGGEFVLHSESITNWKRRLFILDEHWKVLQVLRYSSCGLAPVDSARENGRWRWG